MYAKVLHAQRRMLAGNPDALAVTYEDIVADKMKAMGEIIKLLWKEVDEDTLLGAIDDSGVDEVKAYERKTVNAIVAPLDVFVGDSFSQSGAVGEHVDFFSERRNRLISNELHKHSTPEDGGLC